MKRNRAIIKREPNAMKAKFGSTFFFAFLQMAIFWQCGKDYSYSGVFNFAGAVFFWCTILFMGNMFNVILIF